MKQFLISFLIMSIAIVGHAQDSVQIEPQREFMPDTKNLGVTFNLSGLIQNISGTPRQDLRSVNMLLVRYNISQDLTFRMGLAPTVMSISQNNTDSVGKDLVEYDSTARQAAFSVRPGIEYHFTGTKRLDPYVAFDGEFGIIGKLNAGAITNITDTTGTAKTTRTITQAGGYGFGAKLSLGMNYFIARRLALGLEYGVGVQSLITGGDRQDVTQTDPVSGAATTTRVLSSTRSTNTSFFVDPTVQFTLSYFFSL